MIVVDIEIHIYIYEKMMVWSEDVRWLGSRIAYLSTTLSSRRHFVSGNVARIKFSTSYVPQVPRECNNACALNQAPFSVPPRPPFPSFCPSCLRLLKQRALSLSRWQPAANVVINFVYNASPAQNLQTCKRRGKCITKGWREGGGRVECKARQRRMSWAERQRCQRKRKSLQCTLSTVDTRMQTQFKLASIAELSIS